MIESRSGLLCQNTEHSVCNLFTECVDMPGSSMSEYMRPRVSEVRRPTELHRPTRHGLSQESINVLAEQVVVRVRRVAAFDLRPRDLVDVLLTLLHAEGTELMLLPLDVHPRQRLPDVPNESTKHPTL